MALRNENITRRWQGLVGLSTALGLALLLSTTSFPNSGEAATVNTLAQQSSSKVKNYAPQEPSYLVVETQGETLLAHNEQARKAPASVTKLLTGLVAMGKVKGEDLVTVGDEVKLEGASLNLAPGDQIAVKDLLTAMYSISANDAASALAVKASGSIAAFAQEMNAYAHNLGCTNSHFVNPHGLSDPEHYTTASDYLKIVRAFMGNQELMHYVGQKQAEITWKDKNGRVKRAKLRNTNELLGIYPGDQGIKTGTTEEAGECLVTYVARPDGEIIVLLFGSQHRYQDSIKLLDQGFAKLRTQAALKTTAREPRLFSQSPGLFMP